MKGKKHYLSVLLVLFAALLSGGLADAFANAPVKPVDFYVRVQQADFLEVQWQIAQNTPEATGFNIYVANRQTADPNDFRLKYICRFDDSVGINAGFIYKTGDSNSTNTPAGYFQLMRGILYFGEFESNLQPGVYTLFLTAINDDGESPRSDFRHIQIMHGKPETIRFTSSPLPTGRLNQLYSYDADAVASNGGTVNYEALKVPQGMTVDSLTGVVNWTPTVPGNYTAAILAYLEGNTNVSEVQVWNIRVFICDNMGYITVVVKDKDGNNINNGMVNVYRINPNADSLRNLEFYTNGTISNGLFFSNPLDEGDYKLEFLLNNRWESIWYQNADNPYDATVVNVKCADSVVLNMILTPPAEPKFYNVSGQVTNSKDGNPVPYSMIVFYIHCSRNNPSQRHGFSTLTDANGSYSIRLSDKYKYVAAAYGRKDSTWNHGQKYAVQFYNKVKDYSTADILELTADRTGIDFVLDELPVYANTLSGNVTDSAGNGLANAFIIAYLVENPDPNRLYRGLTVETDQNGIFSFNNLIPGKYILLAIPFEYRNAPGYYKENDFAVHSWKDATLIDVPDQGDVGNIVIKLNNTHQLTGKGRCHGRIGRRHGVIKSGDSPLEEDVIKGAMITILDKNNKVVGYDITENTGSYSVEGLTKGSYKFIADRVSYIPYVANISIDSDNQSLDESFDLEQESLGSEDNYVITGQTGIYPNPAKELLTVKFKAGFGNSEITISEITGVVVTSFNIFTNDGLNTISLDVSALPVGQYYLRVNSVKGNTVFPVTVVR